MLLTPISLKDAELDLLIQGEGIAQTDQFKGEEDFTLNKFQLKLLVRH